MTALVRIEKTLCIRFKKFIQLAISRQVLSIFCAVKIIFQIRQVHEYICQLRVLFKR